MNLLPIKKEQIARKNAFRKRSILQINVHHSVAILLINQYIKWETHIVENNRQYLDFQTPQQKLLSDDVFRFIKVND